jgi:hypothetical protein
VNNSNNVSYINDYSLKKRHKGLTTTHSGNFYERSGTPSSQGRLDLGETLALASGNLLDP